MLDMDQIRDWARLAQSLILELHASNPDHSTFSQAGLLNGLETVEEFLVHGEYGCAIHHLLYMVHESDIPFPEQEVIALHKVAEEIGERNHYTRASQERLPENARQFGYNIPELALKRMPLCVTPVGVPASKRFGTPTFDPPRHPR